MCKYCEGKVDERKYMLRIEGFVADLELDVYIDGNNNLSCDNNMEDNPINFCPMCGRDLNQLTEEEQTDEAIRRG